MLSLSKFLGLPEDVRVTPADAPVLPPTCKAHNGSLPCPQCAEDAARGYAVKMLAGRCANGSELDSGTRWHAVPLGEHGLSWSALCGAEPGRRSAGWRGEDEAHAVTCPRCTEKMKKVENHAHVDL